MVNPLPKTVNPTIPTLSKASLNLTSIFLLDNVLKKEFLTLPILDFKELAFCFIPCLNFNSLSSLCAFTLLASAFNALVFFLFLATLFASSRASALLIAASLSF